jgi:hypothetical protein
MSFEEGKFQYQYGAPIEYDYLFPKPPGWEQDEYTIQVGRNGRDIERDRNRSREIEIKIFTFIDCTTALLLYRPYFIAVGKQKMRKNK